MWCSRKFVFIYLRGVHQPFVSQCLLLPSTEKNTFWVSNNLLTSNILISSKKSLTSLVLRFAEKVSRCCVLIYSFVPTIECSLRLLGSLTEQKTLPNKHKPSADNSITSQAINYTLVAHTNKCRQIVRPLTCLFSFISSCLG